MKYFLVPIDGDRVSPYCTVESLRLQMSRHMFGDSCSGPSVQRECFTVERCGNYGHTWRDPSSVDEGGGAITLIAVEGGARYVGSLDCSEQEGEAGDHAIANVCVASSHRRRGICGELFAHLNELLPHKTFSLTVYAPRELSNVSADVKRTLRDRVPRLLRFYKELGFRPVEYRTPYWHMRAQTMHCRPSYYPRVVVVRT